MQKSQTSKTPVDFMRARSSALRPNSVNISSLCSPRRGSARLGSCTGAGRAFQCHGLAHQALWSLVSGYHVFHHGQMLHLGLLKYFLKVVDMAAGHIARNQALDPAGRMALT